MHGMKKTAARFLSVFTLVSRIPVRAAFTPDYSRVDFWIPALSPAVSLAAGAGAALSALAFKDAFLAAIGAMALQYLAFNLFHLDGLLDTADAMLGWASKERRLEILKDSRIGSYAFFIGSFFLAAKAALLALLFRSGISVACIALLAAPLAGRIACVLVPFLSKPAREKGLGALMGDASAARSGLGALAGFLPLAVFAAASGHIFHGAAAAGAMLLSAAISGLLVAGIYRKNVGGFTGDALGAAVEIAFRFIH
jgi:adenosylcobinamide-GDP ribazoletransferase